jgi:hypothetical protein
VREIPGIFRIRNVDDRCPVVLVLLRQRVERLRDFARAAVVADVRDPSIPLMVNHRLVRAPRLEVAVADELHVLRLGPGPRDTAAIRSPTVDAHPAATALASTNPTRQICFMP